MKNALVLYRSDLCENIEDLPFNLIQEKHFKPGILDNIQKNDIVMFFDDKMMKVIRNIIEDEKLPENIYRIWSVHQSTRECKL
jgi:hypothetical protein